jgi:hypothetical protein
VDAQSFSLITRMAGDAAVMPAVVRSGGDSLWDRG